MNSDFVERNLVFCTVVKVLSFRKGSKDKKALKLFICTYKIIKSLLFKNKKKCAVII